ncbi:MAG: hypothetical protein HYV90_03830 [Candidatus Woesebacteria bacterium]|nr:MAG: hypothetical protein HYV90_03830 [Candidatus Woesebacteria bacterium]
MSEGKIYYFLKNYLLSKGLTLIAGEPPDGSDNVRRVEIRSKNRSGIGSKDSYKIDLIFLKDDNLILIELKPTYNQKDIDKLNTITTERLDDLFDALKERCGITKSEIKNIVKCIGVGSLNSHNIPSDFIGFVVKDEGLVDIQYGSKTGNLAFLEN